MDRLRFKRDLLLSLHRLSVIVSDIRGLLEETNLLRMRSDDPTRPGLCRTVDPIPYLQDGGK